MATSHSFAMVGHRQDFDAIKAKTMSFTESLVHKEHMPTMYRRIYLLTLFQQVGLDDIGERLAEKAEWGDETETLRRLRRLWVNMNAARWFTRISSELQGEELYALMRRAMNIDEEVSIIDKKLADLEEIYEIDLEKKEKQRENKEKEHEKLEHRRNKVVELIVLPAAVFIAFREIMFTGRDEYNDSFAHIYESFLTYFIKLNSFYTLVGCSLILSSCVWCYISGYFDDIKSQRGISRWVNRILAKKWRFLFVIFLICGAFSLAITQPQFDPKLIEGKAIAEKPVASPPHTRETSASPQVPAKSPVSNEAKHGK
jgi:hypothetical protein